MEAEQLDRVVNHPMFFRRMKSLEVIVEQRKNPREKGTMIQLLSQYKALINEKKRGTINQASWGVRSRNLAWRFLRFENQVKS